MFYCMKSYNHLYEKLISDENIELAIKNGFKGKKKKRRRVRKALRNEESKKQFKKELLEYVENFHNMPHTPKIINDGISKKQRTILVPHMMEQAVHHMVCNVLIPIIKPSMYEHSYASIPKRGAYLGKKHIEKMIKRNKGIKYYLKMDIHHFFDTVPHDILKNRLSKIIRDKKFLNILFKIIDVVEVGIPIGFYTSQWLANFFLTPLDHWIKRELRPTDYFRYMDDMVLFSGNKKKLHEYRMRIEKYLHDSFGLNLKSNWQVVQFNYPTGKFKIIKDKKKEIERGRDLDFMGFRFYRNRTTIRKVILHKAKRKAELLFKRRTLTIRGCRQMLSYTGWFKRTRTYKYWQNHISSNVSVDNMRLYVGNFDRRINNEGNMAQITEFQQRKAS